MGLIALVLSIFLTYKVCKKINQNTIGTTRAYIFRAWIVFIFVFCAVMFVFSALGLAI